MGELTSFPVSSLSGVTSITSPNAGLVIAPSSGAVVATLGELAYGTLYGDTFIGPGTNPIQGDVLFNDGVNWHHYPAALAGAGISVNLATNGATITNTGVTSIVAGSGISINAGTGAVTVTNNGVRSVTSTGGTITVTGTNTTNVELNQAHANSGGSRWTAAQWFNALAISASGSPGAITIAGAPGASSFTQTLQNVTDTFAYLSTAQTWGAVQTFPSSDIILNAPTLAGQTTLAMTDTASNFVATFPAVTGTIYVTGMAPSVLAGSANIGVSTTEVFFSFGSGLNISSHSSGNAVPRAGTVQNAYWYGDVNSSSTNVTFTVYKNGVATALTFTITHGATGKFSDTTHSFSVAAGDVLCVGFKSSGTGGFITGYFSMEYDS